MQALTRLFLALSLLSTTREPQAWELPLIRQELTGLLLAGEVMDKREINYIFAQAKDIANDTKLIRARMEVLTGAPPINAHLAFIAERSAINDMLMLNNNLRNHFEACEGLHPGRYGSAIEDTKHLYECWDLLRDAKTDFFYVHVRRQALKKLETMLGVEAFERGMMPPCCPTWRMTGVR